ncbi:NHLP bacteriocin export ABC transporter permease/ATPase subunit [Candidatus Magnetominusculus xianensis]|uniref:NHLP family bacteriocin export ABC transporter permease/ATPase subunit n=1 Tax=Candidatus Magnetominusculus xianensis TaxID=1748249 RepID=A0ABR5SD48_9BACT|nr:NHLP bacteriocin export ABC transporter permease/ATPase subunit [Candidatus Magnetominusculus xianensis]KWT78330.1 NHLP family bacteriocin export ABC transporter permease/ATPase subunit [Candidatus Magnetominusculus xianensis]MBF0402868.1 NHLP bacteriocin export ABC transporter permease/ATPase subunit [Nitrospirota bacterium]
MPELPKMLPKLIEEITKYGQLTGMESNRRIPLADPGSVWIVGDGAIDILSSGAQDNAFAKRYLFSLEPGDLIIGHKGDTGGTGLLAQGKTGSSLIRLPRERLKAYLSDDELSALIDGWLKQLLHYSHNEYMPLKVTLIEPGKEYKQSQTGYFRTSKDIVWIKASEGNLSFVGMKENLQIPIGAMFPVSAESFIETDGECSLKTFSTKDYLREDPELTYIDSFQDMMLVCVRLTASREIEYEKQRLKLKIEKDNDMMGEALREFSTMLTRKKTVSAAAVTADPLLAASILVGRDMAINIKAPVSTPSALKLREPLYLIAKASGIRTRRVALKGRWWEGDNGPMVGFIEANKQPVALIYKKHYTMYDTVQGTQTRVNAQTAESIAQFAYSFYRPFPEETMNLYNILRFSSFRNLLDLVVVLLMGVAGGLLGLVIPLCTSVVFDSIIPMAETSQLLQIGIALLVGALAAAMFQLTGSIAMLRVEGKVDASLQAAVWDRLLALPVSFFRQYTVGDLSNRAMGIDGIRQLITGSVTNTIISSTFSVFSFFLLFYYNLWLALTAFAIVAVVTVITSTLSYIVVYYQQKIFELSGKISGMVFQLIGGIAKFRVSGSEMRGFAQWAAQFKTQKGNNFSSNLVKNIITALNSIYPVVSFMVLYGVYYYKDMFKLLSMGDFLSFTSAFTQFLSAGMQLSATLVNIIAVIPIYNRAKPIFLSMPEVTLEKTEPGELSGDIEIKNIYFRYQEGGQYILKDLSLQIDAGEFVAIVGTSGSGKSTLLRLLLGFEKPERGSVYYDNQNIQSLDVHSLRRQIGVVLQNGQLMSGDIFTNIIGANNLTIDDAWEAARMTGLEDDIISMPMGMHTVIPPGASTISGGQKQRILIARAMVTKPRIFFFDEATSALDNLTQSIVSNSLENFHATRLVIAHRLSTIIKADKIIVIDKGSVVETGNYEELMNKNGLFAQLAKRQLT